MEFSGGVLTVYGPNETASIFATYPTEFLSLGRSFLDQVSLVKSVKLVHQQHAVDLYLLCSYTSLGGGYRYADAVHPGSG